MRRFDWGFDDRQDLFDDAVDGDTIEIVSGSDYLYAFVRNVRGAWVSGTDYAIGDVVTHGGTTYGRRTDPNAHDETTVPSDVLPWQAE